MRHIAVGVTWRPIPHIKTFEVRSASRRMKLWRHLPIEAGGIIVLLGALPAWIALRKRRKPAV